MKNYIISEGRLLGLLANELELEDLENAGVDNWSYYGEHVELEGYDSYHDYALNECLSEFDKAK